MLPQVTQSSTATSNGRNCPNLGLQLVTALKLQQAPAHLCVLQVIVTIMVRLLPLLLLPPPGPPAAPGAPLPLHVCIHPIICLALLLLLHPPLLIVLVVLPLALYTHHNRIGRAKDEQGR